MTEKEKAQSGLPYCARNDAEMIHDCRQGQHGQRRERLPAWLRLVHRERTCREDRPQHLKEHDHRHPGPQDPRVQAGEGLP